MEPPNPWTVKLFQSLCVICRQTADPRSIILSTTQRQSQRARIVSECESGCSCCLNRAPPTWYHPTCHEVLVASYGSSEGPTGDDLEKFARAIKPLYKTSGERSPDIASTRGGLFSGSTRGIMANIFKQDLLQRLPAELQLMIMEFVNPCCCLILLGETRRLIDLLRNYCNPRESITWTKYQGISYLSRVSPEQVQIPARVRRVISSVGHIGIRRIQSLSQNSNPSPDGSPWYEVHEARAGRFEISMESNGLFARAVKDKPRASNSLTWSTPHPPRFNPWNAHNL